MVEGSERNIVEFLIETNKAEIESKKLKIGNKTYRYNTQKPISEVLKKKLNKVKSTIEYKRHELVKKKDAKWLKVDKNKALQSIQKRFKSTVQDEQSAFKSYANSYSVSNLRLLGLKALSYLKYQDVRLKQFIEKHNGMKLRVIGNSVFKKPNDEELLLQIPSRRYEITNKEDIPETLNQIATDIEIQIDRMEVSASGLILKKIEKLVFHYDKYNPTRGGSFIELPKWVQSKKACINIQNEDDMCLKYSVQCGVYKIYENDHACKVSHYKKIDDKILNWEGVKFPSSNLDIERLEENNPEIISVNVYHISSELNDNSILLYRKTKVAKSKYHIDLLKLEEGNKSHYVCIKNYDRLIGSQTNKMKAKKFHCKNCLHGFGSEVLLKKHYENGCMAVEGQQIQMAKEDDKMFFKNHYKKLKAPFVIYADFECLTTHHEKDKNKNTKTEYYQHHRPCGFMINVINSIDGSSEPFLYRGEDCMDVFTDKMIEVKNKIMDKMKENKPMIFNNNNQIDFNNATKCFICGKDFQAGDVKVRDHCHFTGRYRGCAHQDCNLAFSMRYYKIPVFLHNLKNYDAHLIIERANKLSENAKIDVIAQNSERFITFGFKNLCFKDSFSFLSSSLDKLVKLSKYEDNIKRDKWENNFKFSKRNPYVNNLEDLDLLTDKGVYPYDYFDCFEKFDERQLPLKKDFYSKLSQTNIEASEYERAKHIWEHFGIRTLGQYHDLYLRTDVLLLTDVFENFRDLCLEYYGLDPAHYYTLPNFSWDAMLLKTGVEIEPLTDKDMYEMIEKGLRGGMCQVSHKQALANNKYMDDDYDENKPSNYINYLDANNLYGLAMSQKLPIGKLKWGKKTPDIKNWNENDDYAYILEVDLEYPNHLHDEHSDYPLAPENMNITEDLLSEHQKELHRHYYNGKEAKDEKTSKLILNLKDKEKYVVHIKTLKYYLEKGLILKKVHRLVKFHQRQWLKPWIDFNANKRKEAKSDFEKDMFKLMNNAVYGKTMENVRNHIDFELVSTQERLQKCVNNPNYKNRHIINDNLVGVEKTKTILKLDKPIYLGMSILDLSKHHMYSFYYDVLKAKYQNNIKLIYTDTDSYVLQTYTEDIFKDFKEMRQRMDFSDYPKEHPSYDASSKKVLGKMKDECNGKIITNFVALRPKMYCFQVHNQDKEEKKAKGVPKNKVKRDLDMNDYENTLRYSKVANVSFNAIRSKNHQLYSITQTKVGLTSYDNKRYWTDKFKSVPYGYYSI